MSDFSLFSLFTAGLALFAPLTAAYTKPVGDEPKGNPIYQPGLNSLVPAGKAFTVTWDPTTPGTVTLVLLKGPSENAIPQYPIVEKLPNDGDFVWTPSSELEPTDGPEGYGIQLIDDETGQYQYTTQFGISNPDYEPPASTSSSAPSTSTVAAAAGDSYEQPAKGGIGHGPHNVDGGYTHSLGASASGMTPITTSSAPHMGMNGTATGGVAHPTAYLPSNGTMTTMRPTGAYTTKTRAVGGSTATSEVGMSATSSTPAAPSSTGAGAAVVVSKACGLVLAAGAVMFVL